MASQASPTMHAERLLSVGAKIIEGTKRVAKNSLETAKPCLEYIQQSQIQGLLSKRYKSDIV